MTDRPRISLLLPNYNNGPILQTCLDRLVEHTTYPDIVTSEVDETLGKVIEVDRKDRGNKKCRYHEIR